MQRQFSEGDVVVLNSGGPPMTVHHLVEDPEAVVCVWHDVEKRVQVRMFRESAVRKTAEAMEEVAVPANP